MNKKEGSQAPKQAPKQATKQTTKKEGSKSSEKTAAKKIEKNTYIYEVTKENPKAAYIMMNHGLYCAGCHGAMYETVEQGAKVHGLSEKEIDDMVKELNETLDESKTK